MHRRFRILSAFRDGIKRVSIIEGRSLTVIDIGYGYVRYCTCDICLKYVES